VVEFLVGSSPGGGNDKTARTLQRIWQDAKWLDNVVNAGTVRILGVSSAQRSAALPNVPTLRDQGYDHVMGNWAAVVGPRGLGPAQVAYWEDLLERTAHHPDWKGLVEANALEFDFWKSRPTRELMAKDYDLERAMLTELGMVTKP
jgi:putative tricarboxylic transport membrane protein